MNKKIILFSTLTFVALTGCANKQQSSPLTNNRKAEAYYSQGTKELVEANYTKALTNLLEAKKLDPSNSLIRNNLGMAYFFRNQPELAETELKEAIKLDKKNSDAKLNLGSLYLNQKKYREAQTIFLEVEKDLIFKNQHRNYYNLSLTHLSFGDRKKAVEYLNRSIAENPEYCAAYFKLGEIYKEEYRFQQAYESFRNASQGTCTSDPEPHYQQALMLINLNKNFEAQRKLQELKEKFASTRYASLADIQLNKLSNSTETIKTNFTETTESGSIQSPRF